MRIPGGFWLFLFLFTILPRFCTTIIVKILFLLTKGVVKKNRARNAAGLNACSGCRRRPFQPEGACRMGTILQIVQSLLSGLGPIIILVVLFLVTALKVLKEYERGVIFRLGRVIKAKGPGLILLVPVIDRMVKVSLRTVAMDVPPQDVITKDNVSVAVNAGGLFPGHGPGEGGGPGGRLPLCHQPAGSDHLEERVRPGGDGRAFVSNGKKINGQLQDILDTHTDAWGIKVSTVEVKHIDLPAEMKRAMARQAEAERERRAKIINADGEFQAAERLAEAAEIISKHPQAPAAPLLADPARGGGGKQLHHPVSGAH